MFGKNKKKTVNDKDQENCFFVVDTRLNRNGSTWWDPRQSFPRGHWAESLNVFGRIGVLARTLATTDSYSEKVTFPVEVRIGELPYYVGPLAVMRKLFPLILSCRTFVKQQRSFILRSPGFVPIISWFWLRIYRKPYALEILGDPREVFEVVDHPLRFVWKYLYSNAQKMMVKNATAVLYISQTLADRYPTPHGRYSIVASDVRLNGSVYTRSRLYPKRSAPIRLIHIGTMDQPYKGQDYLLKAIDLCRQKNLAVEATFVGEGRLRQSLENLCKELKLDNVVQFRGSVSWGPSLFKLLDDADLFVMCSLTEGLGKALLEAMARGLPAVGSNVGGIPELLPPEVLVQPANVEDLASKIIELAGDPLRLTRLSERNYQESLKYHDDILSRKRTEFYLYFKNHIE